MERLVVDAPVPIEAQHLAAPPDEFIRVTFDVPLVAVAQADFLPADWKATFGNMNYRSVGGWISGQWVYVRVQQVSPYQSPNVISYNARNHQVVGLASGLPAKPFTGLEIKP